MVDVVIIGSGYGGSITAARLAQAGMSVVVLERGPRLTSAQLRQSDDPKYIQTVIDLVVSSSNVAFRAGNLVGGASVPMDGGHFRLPAKSFEAKDSKGRRYWPASYDPQSLAPYYDIAEQVLKVRQLAWSEIPKAGGVFAMMLDKVGASCDRARLNYADCKQCGFCSQGCIYDKKMNMLLTYLPLAEKAGAEVQAGAMVDHVEPKASGYVVRYRKDGLDKEIDADRVIIASGGIHSPALLLRSAKYLPDLSEHVGENFNTNGEHAFIGILPADFTDLDKYYCYQGMDNSGMMTFHWYEDKGFTLHPGGGFEPSVFAAAVASSNNEVLPKKAWGLQFKRFVEQVYPHRVMGFSALGLVEGHRAVVLREDGTPDFEERDRSATDAYLDELESIVLDMGEKTGIALVPSVPRKLAGTTSAHLLSACRMAETIDDGVVGPDAQVFGYENLYVCDASTLPFALAVNPALTISAVAERVAEGIVNKG